MPQPIVVGCGAGFSADRLDPACALAASGRIACLVLECLGERTLAHGHRDRMADPAAGFNRYLEPRLRALLPICRLSGTRIITDMEAANPKAVAETARATARELGRTLGEVALDIVGANAYLGVELMLAADDTGHCRGFPTPPPIRPLPVRLRDRNGGFPWLSDGPWL